ncbi:MAG: hypothetical protein LBH68_08895, partial [Bifidobacteriaceae bacterium]|nr:hypothetical protein [Bifidobacteriaceae bacterium]
MNSPTTAEDGRRTGGANRPKRSGPVGVDDAAREGTVKGGSSGGIGKRDDAAPGGGAGGSSRTTRPGRTGEKRGRGPSSGRPWFLAPLIVVMAATTVLPIGYALFLSP